MKNTSFATSILLFFLLSLSLFSDGNCAEPDNPATKLQIGDSFGGGIVVYILSPGEAIQDISDDGKSYTTIKYDPNVQHGLIASAKAFNDVWSNVEGKVSGTKQSFGSGASNTVNIISQPGHENSAAYYCTEYENNSFSDWFLPSLDEMQIALTILNNLGYVFESDFWTSTEWPNEITTRDSGINESLAFFSALSGSVGISKAITIGTAMNLSSKSSTSFSFMPVRTF